ncbi:hypothetical protein PC9H_004468 [Pleurotus ostreatus]|uniref:Uncharacterized protein n=1 Tax=Pleurotus ostreatus TaxID=5322 RepID=A0A8H7A1Y5_PLEOS|nr:uncharacterized protein PC9H_004468 [Pleurotus ostreatus]KAF7432527.1 hypothetical protein PC9H_004468 [Pleurotus ostreatus]
MVVPYWAFGSDCFDFVGYRTSNGLSFADACPTDYLPISSGPNVTLEKTPENHDGSPNGYAFLERVKAAWMFKERKRPRRERDTSLPTTSCPPSPLYDSDLDAWDFPGTVYCQTAWSKNHMLSDVDDEILVVEDS